MVPPWCAFCVVYHVTRRFLRYVFNRTISVALSWWRVNSLELQTLHKMKRQSETLTHKRKKRNKKKTWITKYKKKKEKKTGAVRQSFFFFSVALNWINLRAVRIKNRTARQVPAHSGAEDAPRGWAVAFAPAENLRWFICFTWQSWVSLFRVEVWEIKEQREMQKDTRRDQICMFYSVTEK